MEHHLSPPNPSELDKRMASLRQEVEATDKDLAALATAADALIAEKDGEDFSENEETTSLNGHTFLTKLDPSKVGSKEGLRPSR